MEKTVFYEGATFTSGLTEPVKHAEAWQRVTRCHHGTLQAEGAKEVPSEAVPATAAPPEAAEAEGRQGSQRYVAFVFLLVPYVRMSRCCVKV